MVARRASHRTDRNPVNRPGTEPGRGARRPARRPSLLAGPDQSPIARHRDGSTGRVRGRRCRWTPIWPSGTTGRSRGGARPRSSPSSPAGRSGPDRGLAAKRSMRSAPVPIGSWPDAWRQRSSAMPCSSGTATCSGSLPPAGLACPADPGRSSACSDGLRVGPGLGARAPDRRGVEPDWPDGLSVGFRPWMPTAERGRGSLPRLPLATPETTPCPTSRSTATSCRTACA